MNYLRGRRQGQQWENGPQNFTDRKWKQHHSAATHKWVKVLCIKGYIMVKVARNDNSIKLDAVIDETDILFVWYACHISSWQRCRHRRHIKLLCISSTQSLL